MRLVLDANVIFSCLMSRKRFYIDLITQNQCFVPDFIFTELNKYDKKILKKSNDDQNFKEYAKEIFHHLVVIPKLAIEDKNWKRAYELCKDIDEKDTTYIALSLDLELPLLTRDKQLHKGLMDKQFEDIILLDKFLEYNNEE